MDRVRLEKRPLNWMVLTGIMLLAAFFRLYRLPVSPRGLSQDEVVNADISLGLLEDGGAPFLAGGYGHEPLFHYLQAGTLILFGDNVMGIRVPAVVAGTLLVAASYALMRRLFTHITAVVTAAGLAFSWWPVVFSRIGIRAITFPLLLVLAIRFFWQGVKLKSGVGARSRVAYSRFVLAGALLGLAFYTYTAALFVIPLVVIWLGYGLLLQRDSLQQHWRGLATVLSIAVVLAAPLLLYLYAHPELTERLEQLNEPLRELRNRNLEPLWQSVGATLGMFSLNGEGRWTYGIPGRPLFDIFSSVLLYLGLVRCAIFITRPQYGLVLIWLLVMLVPSMLTPDAPSTIRAIGALPAVYGMIGIAVDWLWGRVCKLDRAARIGFALALALLFVGNIAWTVRDGFYVWAVHPKVYWLYKTHFADIAQFIDSQAKQKPVIVNEEWIAPLDLDGVRRNLQDDTRQPRWIQAGRVFIWPAGAEEFVIAVPIYSSTDAELWHLFAGDPPVLSTSAYGMEDGRPGVTFYRVQSEPVLTQLLKQSSMERISTPNSSHVLRAPVNFGNEYSLLGYEILGEALPGRELRIVTIWRVMRDAPSAVSVFTHILDANGDLISQDDGFDLWAPALYADDIFAQLHSIDIPANVAAGSYQIQAGMYIPDTEGRLPVTVGEDILADRVWLDAVEVIR